MSSKILLILFFINIFAFCCSIIVETNYGSLEGFEYLAINGKETEIFLGIPFASPPIGELRFEKPQPPKKWTSIQPALNFGPPCATFNPLLFPEGKEDCLYLNIFRPKNSPPLEGFSVLVWIHGGSFQWGSTEFYGYKNISNNFVSEGIIVVTVAYRLGPFGFFSSGDSRIPGNLGLWDLTQALKFLQEILPQFHGDPKRITLWGHSAGAGAISMLSASPEANSLFSQVIEMSGTVYTSWVSSINVIDKSKSFSHGLGCDFSAKNLKQCLKNASIDEFHAVGKNWLLSDSAFNPLIDGNFLKTESFDEAFSKAPKMLTLMGVTSQEALFRTSRILPYFPENRPFFLSPESAKAYMREDLIAYIRSYIASEKNYGKNAFVVAKQIIEFYLKDENSIQTENYYFQKYNEIISDFSVNIPIIRETKVKASNSFPTFLYVYNHDLPQNISKFQIPGTPHAAEWTPLFGIHFFGEPFEFNDADKKAQQNLIQTFVSFAKTGRPKTADIDFPFTTESGLEFVEILSNPFSGNNFGADKFEFWTIIGMKYEFDITQGHILSETNQGKTEL